MCGLGRDEHTPPPHSVCVQGGKYGISHVKGLQDFMVCLFVFKKSVIQAELNTRKCRWEIS